VAPEHDVVEHRHAAEQGEVLEGAADAERRDPVARHLQQRARAEQDFAAVALVEARQAVEERGLAGAVRPDQPDDVARRDIEGDPVQRDDAAEADADLLHAQ
jgi:hypothetical protein